MDRQERQQGKKVLDNPPGRMVVGHGDWGAKYFRFRENKVCVFYDWENLRLDKKTALVRHMATHFPYTEYFDVPSRVSPEEARLFVEEYEMTRGAPFFERERVAVSVAATYGLAYTVRCAHAMNREDKDLKGSFRGVLSPHAAVFPASRVN
jgi:hypothetical protein